MHPDNSSSSLRQPLQDLKPSADVPPSLRMQMLHQAAAQETSLVEETVAATAAAAATPATPATPVDEDQVSTPSSATALPSTLRKAAAPVLDLESTDMFPSLGSSSPRPSASTTWGASSRVKSSAGSKLGAVGDQRHHRAGGGAPASPPRASPSAASSGLVTERAQIRWNSNSGFGKVGDITKDVAKATSTTIESSTSQVTQTTTFLVKGKAENVQSAMRLLKSKFSKKDKVLHPVPSSARRHILGAKGRTLASIQQKTGVQITVPQRTKEEMEQEQEAAFESGDINDEDLDVEEKMVDVVIEGDIEGIVAARAEIDQVISRACRSSYRLSTIPPMFYTFMGSFRDQIQEETNTRIIIPHFVSSQDDDEDEDSKDVSIVILGDRKAIRKAIEKLDETYHEVERTTRTMTINIPKRQHRFLIGVKGANVSKIHSETGCTIEIPLATSSSDSVVIRGPEEALLKALGLVMEKANSSLVETVDVISAHKAVPGQNKVEHARRVARYLAARSRLRKIEQELDGVQISLPRSNSESDSQVVIEIVAKSRSEVEAARAKVIEAVKSLVPAQFDVVLVEPLLHRHVIGRKGQNILRIREKYGVEVMVPEANSDSHELVLVYEDSAAATTDVAKVRTTLETVKQELEKLAADHMDFATKILTVPARLHGNVIGPKGSTLNAIMGLEPTTSVRLGLPRTNSTEATAGKKTNNNSVALTEDSIVIKGPKEEVERVAREITAFVEETKHHQIINSYTVSFEIPASASPHVIGKGGSNINKLTEQFQVKFDLNDKAPSTDKKATKKSSHDTMEVIIQGVKKNVEAAKENVMKLVEQLADATEVLLDIPVEYHSALIGTKGNYVRRLEETYGVRIQFPKAVELEDEEDKAKLNVVKVSGGKKGVQGAKKELLELVEFEKENNHTVEMKIEPKVLPHVVGRNGVKINEIQEMSGARVDIQRSGENEDGKPTEVRIVLTGTKAAVKKSQQMVNEIVEAQKSQVEELVEIHQKYHKILIGQGGSTLREIIAKAGGPAETSAQAGLVKFQNSNNAVLLKGDKTVVEKIKQQMLEMVAEQDAWTTIVVAIPAKQHRQVIGPQFSNVREIENKYNVRIQFPNKNTQNSPSTTDSEGGASGASAVPASDRVTIKGLRDNCEKAKTELESKIKTTFSTSYTIPRRYRQAVFAESSWKIRNDYNVAIVHPRGEGNNNQRGASKRIDVDDENVTHGITEGLSWELYDNSGSSQQEGEAEDSYTVQLQGEEAQTTALAAHLNKLLEKAKSVTHVLKMRVPTTYHGLIIGSAGSQIKQIETESGCSTKVAKGEELITITGSLKGVEKARAMIVRIVSNSDKRDGGRS
ncbi:hypothetical protein DFQ27_005662 [Actinomortierella ambigua]|uniref:K Homology domain-containing protein n=1 Tax=Actinomortierella ambigua TaxID=1343610 RepID=A0A9P6Q1T6_9FUNG|nr:hypothetical protein DFQ27_005662 [Actinomortierella ambigua]